MLEFELEGVIYGEITTTARPQRGGGPCNPCWRTGTTSPTIKGPPHSCPRLAMFKIIQQNNSLPVTESNMFINTNTNTNVFKRSMQKTRAKLKHVI